MMRIFCCLQSRVNRAHSNILRRLLNQNLALGSDLIFMEMNEKCTHLDHFVNFPTTMNEVGRRSRKK